MKPISIITPCYNEEENVTPLYERIEAVFRELPAYTWELIFIDNHSSDRTVAVLKALAAKDPRVKVIVNARNFGQVRSPYHALLQAYGDAVIAMSSDLQDPPEMIRDFLAKWEEGFKIVAAVKTEAQGSRLMWMVRQVYYRLNYAISDIQIIQNFTGFGLYDQRVVQVLREMDDPHPYFRGMISEIGFEVATIPFSQPRRARGVTKNNFYPLYDLAMLGITSHSKVPLRLATMGGFALSVLSMGISLTYLVLKLAFWYSFTVGVAPVLIGLFFSMSIQLFFIGLLGEYVAAIHTQVMKRPLVVEQERINFTGRDATDAPGAIITPAKG